jgi:hypothetical protein
MKRIKYKKELPSLNESLKLIPNEVKVDNEVFEMTDGNKTFKVRWEGSLKEGHGVILSTEDKQLVNEDIEKMKTLWGYKPQETIGTPTAKSRVNESETFKKLFSTVKKKALIEEAVLAPISELTEEELLDEGIMSNLLKAAMILGISLTSFKAMAQENPKKAVDVIEKKIRNLNDKEIDDLEKQTGISFTKDAADQLFYVDDTDYTQKEIEPLYLGKYGDVNAVKVIKTQRLNDDSIVYHVQVSPKYSYDAFNNIRSYIGKQNKGKVNGVIIKFFNHKGEHMGGEDITFK